MSILDFPGGTMDKNPPANAGDTVSIQEDSTGHRTAESVGHNYSASAPEHKCNYQACALRLLKSTCLEPVFCDRRSSAFEYGMLNHV